MIFDTCCDLQIHINGENTFFLDQKIITAYSGRVRKMIRKYDKKSAQIVLDDFPGGGRGFELVLKFCYNRGKILMTAQNVCTLYCASVYLGMEDTLLQKVEDFLNGIFYSQSCWEDVLVCLRNCDPFFYFAESSGLTDKLITILLSKIAHNSENSFHLSPTYSSTTSSSSSDSSRGKPKAWWFDDLATLSPLIIQKVIKNLGAYGSNNTSLLLTKFLLHYLKTKKKNPPDSDLYSGLADTAVYGVILMGETKTGPFSCRTMLWVLKLGCGFDLSRVCRSGLEKLIGSVLDSAKLDDLLVSSTGQNNVNCHAGVYDVNLVVRLVRVFVQCQGISIQRLKKVGWLIDQYLAEISPDHNLQISKFMAVAQTLPDTARDCFDGVYRAIDIYLESHPTLSFEERSRLCQCLNYEKLTLEACKDLAKNPRIPPRDTIQALAAQKLVSYEPSSPRTLNHLDYFCHTPDKKRSKHYGNMVYYEHGENYDSISQGSANMKLNMQRMQWRLLELEKLCRKVKGQMSKLVRFSNKSIHSSIHN